MQFRSIGWFSLLFCLLFSINSNAQTSTPYAYRFGTAGPERLADMCVDQSGSYVMAFEFQNPLFLEGGPGAPRTLLSNGSLDSAIAKFDFQGTIQWAYSWGSSSADQPVAIACDRNSNVYVAGNFSGTMDANPQFGTATLTNNGSTDVYVIKFTSAGNFLWAQSFGGTQADEVSSLQVSPEGSLLLGMTFSGQFDADPDETDVKLMQSAGGKDIALLRLTTNGELVWANVLGGAGDDGVAGTSSQIEVSGEVIVLGSFQGTIDLDPSVGQTNLISEGLNDAFVARYDNEGKLKSAFRIGGAGDVSVPKRGVGLDAEENLYLLLNFSGSVDADLLQGTRMVSSQAGSTDLLVGSYTRTNLYRWHIQVGGSANETGNSLHVGRNGNLLLSGLFRGLLDIDPSSNSFPLFGTATNGASDTFVAKYRTANGALVDGIPLTTNASGAGNTTSIVAAALDSMGNYVIAGNLLGTDVDFDFSNQTYAFSNQGAGDLFLASYDWRKNLRRPVLELQQPLLRANTNAASFQAGPAVPGGIGTLFGLNISTKLSGFTKPDIARTIPVATKLCNTEVIFRDPETDAEFKAPILFCSDNQINYQVPTQLPQKFFEVSVRTDDRESNALEVNIVPDDVALFMENFQQQQGALVFGLGPRRGQKVTPSNGVTACDVMEIYLTGMGPVIPTLPPDGDVAREARAALGDAKVVIYDDGTKGFLPTPPRFLELRRADGFIKYTGIAPNFVGLYQVNMEWPNPQFSTTPADLRLRAGNYPAYIEFAGKRSLVFIIPVDYSSQFPVPCRGAF